MCQCAVKGSCAQGRYHVHREGIMCTGKVSCEGIMCIGKVSCA